MCQDTIFVSKVQESLLALQTAIDVNHFAKLYLSGEATQVQKSFHDRWSLTDLSNFLELGAKVTEVETHCNRLRHMDRMSR